MKYKLLGVSTPSQLNIGDYIQALAASQYLPQIDGFIQREELSDYQKEEAKMIMNGWYMHQPRKWPPSPNIKPLLISIHINSLAKNEMLRNESIDYFRKHAPVGCRDINTMLMLKENDVDAYFSGCLTLTLGKKYFSTQRENKCYFVDPYFKTNWNLFSLIKNSLYLLFNWTDISLIAKKYPLERTGIRKKLILTTFYREYQKIFTRQTLLNAEYINQQSQFLKNDGLTEDDYLHKAESLVKKYAKAQLVITSRIHCALPCLGLETPVLYTEDSNQSEASACRLNGLRELFNVIAWKKNSLVPQFNFNGKLSIGNNPANKTKWKELASNLVLKSEAFIKNDN